ncbi:hypothetical protein IU486_09020 [Streptomyces gardneri]|nr:hypothetical protein [Streptomyces gardneri]
MKIHTQRDDGTIDVYEHRTTELSPPNRYTRTVRLSVLGIEVLTVSIETEEPAPATTRLAKAAGAARSDDHPGTD